MIPEMISFLILIPLSIIACLLPSYLINISIGKWFAGLMVPFSIFIFVISLTFLMTSFRRIIIIFFPLEKGIFDLKTKKPNIKHRINFSNWVLVRKLLDITFLIMPSDKSFLYSLMGAKIGRGTRIYGKLFEPELVVMGENCVVGEGAIISAHVYDKGKITLSPVNIGNNCVFGGYSIVLPGADISDNVNIGALTVVPKFKKIRSGTVYFKH